MYAACAALCRPVLSRELRQLTAGADAGNAVALEGALGSISLLSPVRAHAGCRQPRPGGKTVPPCLVPFARLVPFAPLLLMLRL